MENLFSKNLKLILLKNFLRKVINLDFSKKFFLSKPIYKKSSMFSKKFF